MIVQPPSPGEKSRIVIAVHGGLTVQLDALVACRTTGAVVVTRNNWTIVMELTGTAREHADLLRCFPRERVTRLSPDRRTGLSET